MDSESDSRLMLNLDNGNDSDNHHDNDNDNPHDHASLTSPPSILTPTRTHSHSHDPRGLQTSNPNQPQQEAAPPLLPAFLITGLLLAAIVFIIIWRHYIERRRSALRAAMGIGEEDDVWANPHAHPNGSAGVEKPKMWDAFPVGASDQLKEKWEGWESVMPLSATPFFGPPKRQQPRYLIPSDRPTPFMTRMFGGAMEGYRFRSRDPASLSNRPARARSMLNTLGPMGGNHNHNHNHNRPNDYDPSTAPAPMTSTVAYTNRQAGNQEHPELGPPKGLKTAEIEDEIEKIQLAFVIAMPVEHQDELKAKTSEERNNLNWKQSKTLTMTSLRSELCLGSLMIPYG